MSTSEEHILDMISRLDVVALERLCDRAAGILAQKAHRPGPRRHPGPAPCQAALFTVPHDLRHLETEQIERLTAAFDAWRDAARNAPIRRARERMRLVYLMLRHSGAKLGEVLALNERTDIDLAQATVGFGGTRPEEPSRRVVVPQTFLDEVERFAACPANRALRGELFHLDPGFVRRKLYEQARKAGLPTGRVSPTSLRHSRAVELLRSGVPLPVVQVMLGHSSLVLTSIYCSFSDQDCRRIVNHCVSKESRMKTSARNTFFGAVTSVRKSPLLTEVSLAAQNGFEVISVITNESFERLGLTEGGQVTALVKAPWVLLGKDEQKARTSARNCFPGRVVSIRGDGVAVEIMGLLDGGTPMCALITAESVETLDIKEGDTVWFFFKAFSVILSTE
ncbi:molybdenum-pterin binding protein [Solidesulfovibrio carbinoliphilus subsp. oakridgensis]|uniref:Molybdenum-pterin binding protein n=2 Tax=Solidesulfovibrio carbinoliphilus TaxID=345370 RepID=G7Q612_9BACT|nr:molybdenum-pterin binding protein [Solidesulfovibrio carbinoliphilus subsp. oakridgensis]